MNRSNVHIHHLLGCRPTPLAHYLKAIAILRLVGEQADPTARGWWESETFHLMSSLERPALEEFFLRTYRPTPLIAPWNGGSGFYAKDNTVAIQATERSAAARFCAYRDAIRAARVLIGGSTAKPGPGEKTALFAAARRTWRGPTLAWLDSVVVLSHDGDPSYPPILGTGGNDGRLDFTNNFMQRLCRLFDMKSPDGVGIASAELSLRTALFGSPSRVLEPAPTGMFLPGSGGGPNSGAGFEGLAAANPWDYVLMLEGAVCFSSGLTQRTRTDTVSSSPFTVPKLSSDAVGYATAATDADTRGEQWMPLWSAPATIGELKVMLAEGRRQVGRTGAESSTDMARATARLGVARGITAFERYGYLERNGQSFVAVPLGRWKVHEQPNQRLLDQVQSWVSLLSRAARDTHAPAGVSRRSRVCQDAMLWCCRDGGHVTRWQRLLTALGDAEQALVSSRRFAAEKRLRTLPPLDPGWLPAADDGSPEFVLARALASLAFRSDAGYWDRGATVRHYWLPIDRYGRLDESADAPLSALADLERASIALVRRAFVDFPDGGLFPLIPAHGGAARLDAIALFLDRRTDDAKVLALARPLMAVDWPHVRVLQRVDAASAWDCAQQTAYALVRVAYAAWPEQNGGVTSAKADPAIFHRLATGDMSGVSVAARRVRAAGAQTLIHFGVGPGSDARRLAAALVFGVDTATTRRLKSFITAPRPQREAEEVLS